MVIEELINGYLDSYVYGDNLRAILLELMQALITLSSQRSLQSSSALVCYKTLRLMKVALKRAADLASPRQSEDDPEAGTCHGAPWCRVFHEHIVRMPHPVLLPPTLFTFTCNFTVYLSLHIFCGFEFCAFYWY